jgi:chorismate synthase
MKALEDKGVYIGTHIKKCHNICDRNFETLKEDIDLLSKLQFPVLDETIAMEMTQDIEKASEEGDSLGGILETAVIGVPEGVGEPWFDSVESMLSHGLFSIPAVKGVEFGAGFKAAEMTGLQHNDPICDAEGHTSTNNAGGIVGGISNGNEIVVRAAIKPTPSISAEQQTFNFESGRVESLVIKGRHDVCITLRAAVVVEAAAAIALADLSLRA